MIWEETSQNSDTFQPLFILPGKESEENVRKMAYKLDNDASDCETFEMTLDDKNVQINCEFEFVGDGKVLKLCAGCGGADCTCCVFTAKEHHDHNNIDNGLPMNRSIALCHELWNKLRKNKKGEIITKTGDYAIRKGQKKFPMLKFLDPTKSIPLTHFPIRMMSHYINVFIHLRARDHFPRGIPIMDGSFKFGAQEFVDIEHGLFIASAKEELKLLIDCPDPHGSGGTTNDGNTARLFLGKKRSGVIRIALLRSDQERSDADEILKNTFAIFRVVSSMRYVHMNKFEDLVKSTMKKMTTAWPFAPTPISGIRMLLHCIEKMKKRGGRGLGHLNEGPLECGHKDRRRIWRYHTRQDCLENAITDTMHYLVVKTNYIQRSLREKVKKKKDPLVTDVDRIVASMFVDSGYPDDSGFVENNEIPEESSDSSNESESNDESDSEIDAEWDSDSEYENQIVADDSD